MPRHRTTGVKPVHKKLADGTVRTYYYDRVTGTALGTDREAATDRAVSSPTSGGVTPGSITALIVDYRRSPAFAKLKPNTRDQYGFYLDLIRSEWGDLPVASFRPRFVAKIQERYRELPRKANHIVCTLRILMGLAVRQELIGSNPISRPGLLPMRPRTQLWSREDQAAFLAAAPDRLRLAFMLLLYTVQRPSDVLSMTKGQVYERDGRLLIELRQQKTGTLVAVPVHRELEPILRTRLADKNGGMLLIPSPRGRPWPRRNFSRSWDATVRRVALRQARELFRLGWSKEMVRVELEKRHRQRRDLRRTGIVRMAEAGVTTPQIAAVSGHAIDYCQRIIDTYLPRRTEVAIAAMQAWEAGEQATKADARVVRLSDHGALVRGRGRQGQ